MAETEGFSGKRAINPVSLRFQARNSQRCYKNLLQNCETRMKTRHLIQRNAIWYARLAIPQDVRHLLGNKREFIQTLKTHDLKLAQIQSKPLIAHWQGKIYAARQSAPNDFIWHTSPQPIQPSVTLKRTPFEQHAEAFIAFHYTHPKTIQDVRRAIQRFSKLSPVIELTKPEHVTQWVNSEKRSRSSVSKTKNILAKYWRFLQKKQIASLSLNPFSNIDLPTRLASRVEREAYTDDELLKILCALTEKEDYQLLNITMLAMYTGARISELCGLTTQNVIQNEGFACLNITQSKTKSGIRRIPIHPMIQTMIEKLVSDSTDGYLITEVNSRGNNHSRADTLGKRFGRVVRKVCDLPETKVFHSIRNTVATKLEAAGISENIAADILGHRKDTMTYGLYSGGTSVNQQHKAISTITYNFT